MAKILYYDASAGISGDMNLAALVALGVDFSYLCAELGKLNLNDEFRLARREILKSGISATKIDVICARHKFSGLNLTRAKNANGLKFFANYSALDSHSHGRNFAQICSLINRSNLSPFCKEKSLKIFARVAEAEAKIHGVSAQDVHFHEVGAVDSIVDIVGAAICLEALGNPLVICGSVELGGGFVRCAHGVLSVPAPATAEILRGVPVSLGRANFEMTTPTGAAILRECVNEFLPRIGFEIERVGYGAGSKDAPNFANVLRVMLCQSGENLGRNLTSRDAAQKSYGIQSGIEQSGLELMHNARSLDASGGLNLNKSMDNAGEHKMNLSRSADEKGASEPNLDENVSQTDEEPNLSADIKSKMINSNEANVKACRENGQNLARNYRESKQILIQTNIDDMDAESLAYACEILREAGALDVFLRPIFMKKGRAGTELNVLCREDSAIKFKRLIFAHTTAIGVREIEVKKTELAREFTGVQTKYGRINLKLSYFEGGVKFKPEFEECKAAAVAHGVSLSEVRAEVIGAYDEIKAEISKTADKTAIYAQNLDCSPIEKNSSVGQDTERGGAQILKGGALQNCTDLNLASNGNKQNFALNSDSPNLTLNSTEPNLKADSEQNSTVSNLAKNTARNFAPNLTDLNFNTEQNSAPNTAANGGKQNFASKSAELNSPSDKARNSMSNPIAPNLAPTAKPNSTANLTAPSLALRDQNLVARNFWRLNSSLNGDKAVFTSQNLAANAKRNSALNFTPQNPNKSGKK